MTQWERLLERWQSAGLIDGEAAARIRQYESQARPGPGGLRWPVVVAVALGALLLGAGILLFVGAHWEELSPPARLLLVLASLAGLHGAGAWYTERFRALSMALHALGTVALGAAIFLAGQIFNLEEHWPNGILLWMIGALAGWYLRRDWPHAALAGVLVPAWVFSEWMTRRYYRDVFAFAFLSLLAFTYLSADFRGGSGQWRKALVWIGSIALLPAVVLLAFAGSRSGLPWNWQPVLAFGLPLVLAWLLRREAAWKNGVSAAWVLGLSLMAHTRMDLPLVGWFALGSVGLIAWGIDEARAVRVNLGMAGFAFTVLAFYFSELMDKLGRSLSMIVLGLLFLGGGWYLEQWRRRLVARIGEGGR